MDNRIFRIPRFNLLHFLYKYGNIESEKAAKIVFERINTTFENFYLVVKDIESHKLIHVTNLNITPSSKKEYFFPEGLKNLKIILLSKGEEYIKSKIEGVNHIEQSLLNNPTDNIPLVGKKCGFRYNDFIDMEYSEFFEEFKGKLKYDIRNVYFILTGKYPSSKKQKIFISYSWENDEHKNWVKDYLFKKIKHDFDIILDVKHFYGSAGSNSYTLMKRAIVESSKVLMILTPDYKHRADLQKGGVGFETKVINEQLIKYVNPHKFVPLLREGDSKTSFPHYLNDEFYISAKKGEKFMRKLKERLEN